MMMVYRKARPHRVTAIRRSAVRARTTEGAVKMPVPTILLTMKEKTSKVVSGPAVRRARGGTVRGTVPA